MEKYILQESTMKYLLKFKLENMPELVIGEVETDTPFKAGLMLQEKLKARVGEKKFGAIESATIYDDAGNMRALLQIDTSLDKATNAIVRKPRWDCWLTIRNSPKK